MTPTTEQQREIEALIESGCNTAQIMRKTGYEHALIMEARRERCARKARERAAKTRAQLALDQYITPTGDLLAALRAHMPMLTSLPLSQRPLDTPASVIGWAA